MGRWSTTGLPPSIKFASTHLLHSFYVMCIKWLLNVVLTFLKILQIWHIALKSVQMMLHPCMYFNSYSCRNLLWKLKFDFKISSALFKTFHANNSWKFNMLLYECHLCAIENFDHCCIQTYSFKSSSMQQIFWTWSIISTSLQVCH